MANSKPKFKEDESIISVIAELHSYLRDMQSYYKITKGDVLSHLDAEIDPSKKTELQLQLQEINRKIDYFHVLNNAISIADVVVHTEEMIKEFN